MTQRPSRAWTEEEKAWLYAGPVSQEIKDAFHTVIAAGFPFDSLPTDVQNSLRLLPPDPSWWDIAGGIDDTALYETLQAHRKR